MNFTVTVPEGTTNRGNPALLCMPAEWYRYILFFFANYVAHAATTVPTPGRGTKSSIVAVVAALLLPGSAITSALAVILRRPATEKDPLKSAARAGALCIVLEKRRSHCRKESLDQWYDPPGGYTPVVGDDTCIHGQYWLHKDYYLATVPPTGLPNLKLNGGQKSITAEPASFKEQSETVLSSSHNLLKLSASLAQSVWAAITIYRASGDQIQQYGYAAFGLTVAPYATMSIINTIANILTREYPAMFVLRTPLLTKLENEQKVFFNGALDVIIDATPPDSVQKGLQGRLKRLGTWVDVVFLQKQHHQFPDSVLPVEMNALLTPLSLLVSLVPLAIVGGLSGFQQGNSTQMQRGFTMSWLIVGIVYGVMAHDILDPLFLPHRLSHEKKLRSGRVRNNPTLYFAIPLFVLAVPVVGGMVMVAQMIGEFGVCTLFK
ncbi:hypothetical protein QBC44DRAFT_391772 [Cladorrhinum sp. PSN332]|nr:hypothetical protein QBC44DRAFT_391772 [Cladorrhinum sp. PSN332]